MDLPLDDYYQVAEIQLSYHSKISRLERPQIKSSEDSHRIFRAHWDDAKLDFIKQSKVLLLNRPNHVLGICDLSTGCATITIMDARMIFAAALKANAGSIILAHNHPSSNLEPSSADKEVTDRLREAGGLLNILLIDHLILGRTGYYSFADQRKHLLADQPALLFST